MPKKRCSPAKRWCFTWNNYPEDFEQVLLEKGDGTIEGYIFGEEVASTGTAHIQGYIECSRKIRAVQHFEIEQIHWEVAKGDRAANIKYCSKEGKYVKSTHFFIPRPIKTITSLRPWQQEVVDMIKQEADDRSIHWYWEANGNVGKSALVKYLVVHHGAIMGAGKAADMKYAIVKYHERHGVYPEIIILDIPRSNLNYVSYTGIEEIKNGCFSSSKYESDTVVMNCPHVLCFANEGPRLDSMSVDRWNVHHIAVPK